MNALFDFEKAYGIDATAELHKFITGKNPDYRKLQKKITDLNLASLQTKALLKNLSLPIAFNYPWIYKEFNLNPDNPLVPDNAVFVTT